MNQLVNYCIAFFYIFGFSFKGGSGFNSSWLVAIYLIANLFTKKRYLNKVIWFLKTKYFKNIIFLYLTINVYIFVVLIVNKSIDFSFVFTFLHMFILICVGILLFFYYYIQGKESEVVNYIIIAFVAQSIIEWMAFSLPIFKEFINYTKSASTIALGESYGGIRANALSGSDFFGLSSAFAVVFLIFWSSKNTLFKNNLIIKILIYIVLITGTFFSGRTGYVGLGVSIIYLCLMRLHHVRKMNSFSIRVRDVVFSGFVIVAIFFLVKMFISQYITNINIENLFNFTFQAIINKKNTGSFDISSLQSLRNMYIKIDPITFFIGDGRYMLDTGGYYMGTDVGYLRVILFMGIIGLLMLFLLQIFILKPRKGLEKLLKKMLLLLLMILNLKGEVFVWGQILVAIIILYSLQDLFVFNRRQSAI